jgi:hypothetical protein
VCQLVLVNKHKGNIFPEKRSTARKNLEDRGKPIAFKQTDVFTTFYLTPSNPRRHDFFADVFLPRVVSLTLTITTWKD